MKFFKPEDFLDLTKSKYPDVRGCAELLAEGLAETANKKLEREGVVVYQDEIDSTLTWHDDALADEHMEDFTHKALLINVEKLEGE